MIEQVVRSIIKRPKVGTMVLAYIIRLNVIDDQ